MHHRLQAIFAPQDRLSWARRVQIRFCIAQSCYTLPIPAGPCCGSRVSRLCSHLSGQLFDAAQFAQAYSELLGISCEFCRSECCWTNPRNCHTIPLRNSGRNPMLGPQCGWAQWTHSQLVAKPASAGVWRFTIGVRGRSSNNDFPRAGWLAPMFAFSPGA